MEKTVVNPARLAKPAGYAHGICTEGGRLLFVAGQLGTNVDGEIVSPNDLSAQFGQALSNLEVVVSEAGGKVTDIVKLTIFITDKESYLANLRPIGGAYRSVMGRYFPAITLVEVKSLFDDQALVEIEGMAVIGATD